MLTTMHLFVACIFATVLCTAVSAECLSVALQVVFSFADYDDICRRLQSRQLQPSLLGSSALIPYATLGSLR